MDALACPECGGEVFINNRKDKILCDACKLICKIKAIPPLMHINKVESSA